MEYQKKMDLIDTRGRKTAFSTANSRRDSVFTVPEKKRRTRSSSRERGTKKPRPSVDLGALLKPIHLPPDKYYAVQGALCEQDEKIAERNKVIQDRDAKVKSLSQTVDNLEKQLRDARAKADSERERAEKGLNQILSLQKQLNAAKNSQKRDADEFYDRKRYLQGVNNDQADLMHAGRKVLAGKNEETTQLAAANNQLRAIISDKDRTIFALNDQIFRITAAPNNMMASIAVEAQAQRTLELVENLKADIGDRDFTIESLEAENEDLNLANAGLRTENEGWKSRTVSSERAYQSIQMRDSERNAILEDQNKLIEKLMKDNALLLESGHRK